MTVIVTFPSKHPWACVIELPEISEDWPMAPAAAAAGAPISLQFCGFSVEGPSLSNPHHGGVAILCWGLNRKRGGLTAGPSPHGAAGRSGPPIWPAWLGAPGGVGDCALSSFLLEEETQNFNKGSPKETALGGVTEQGAGGPPRCPGSLRYSAQWTEALGNGELGGEEGSLGMDAQDWPEDILPLGALLAGELPWAHMSNPTPQGLCGPEAPTQRRTPSPGPAQSSTSTPAASTPLASSSLTPPEKGEACKEGRRQPRPLTTQHRDASHVTAARVPCGELQSHPHRRSPFQLVHQGHEDLGWHWDLQGE